jgi:hypothetical protein
MWAAIEVVPLSPPMVRVADGGYVFSWNLARQRLSHVNVNVTDSRRAPNARRGATAAIFSAPIFGKP